MKKNPWAVIFTVIAIFMFLGFLATVAAFYTAFGDKPQVVSGQSVMLLEVKGVIRGSSKFIRTLKKYRDDDDIKAIVIRLNSPGGEVGPSQEVFEEIKRTRALTKKPVYCSFGSVAASGAFYMAMGCDKIFTNPGTLTGSIGVIMNFANLSKLYSWAKIDRYAIKTGPFKDSGAEYRAMTPVERSILQNMVNNVLEQFKAAIVEGRGLKPEVVSKLADGRIFTGAQAVEYGLADELGGLTDAIDAAAKAAKIEGEPEVFRPKPPRGKFLQFLMDSPQDDEFFEKAEHLLKLDLMGKPLFLMPGTF